MIDMGTDDEESGMIIFDAAPLQTKNPSKAETLVI